MADLLVDMRDYLVAQALARRPREATPAAPPLWLEPRNGVPAPGEGNNSTEVGADAVLGAYLTGGIPARPFESSLREDTVDIWFRTTSAARAVALQTQLRGALIDRRQWVMGSRTVIDCEEWRALQRLGSDDQSYSFVWSLIFQTYA